MTYLPELRERPKKIATDKKRNITAVVLIPGGEPALQQAKTANCDYLLQMNVDLVNEVSCGSGTPGPDVNHTGMERAVDGRIVIKYRLQSLNDDDALADERHAIEDKRVSPRSQSLSIPNGNLARRKKPNRCEHEQAEEKEESLNCFVAYACCCRNSQAKS